MAAHAEIADVVEEDHAGGAGGIDGRAQQRADDRVGAARFIDYGRAKEIVLGAEEFEAFGERPRAEVRTAVDDQARGLAAGVGVDEVDGLHEAPP
jgi:hypothetical protein